MPTRALRSTLRRSVKSIVGLGATTKYTTSIHFSHSHDVHDGSRAGSPRSRAPRGRAVVRISVFALEFKHVFGPHTRYHNKALTPLLLLYGSS